MKNILACALILSMLFTLAACGSSAGGKKTGSGSSASQPESSSAAGQAASGTGSDQKTGQAIDVDLTQLSSTMVYSEVYNMLYTPEDYIGKTVKMNGAFALYCQETDENGQPVANSPIYYACVIADATACCSQGMEFVLKGDHSYPEDYPDLGDEITVTGTFETYEEDGYTYCHLTDAEMAV